MQALQKMLRRASKLQSPLVEEWTIKAGYMPAFLFLWIIRFRI